MTPAFRDSSRQLSPQQLINAMRVAREATWNATLDLTDEQWMVDKNIFIQPTAWDLSHIGWFWEFWLMRAPHCLDRSGVQQAATPAKLFGPDLHFDSSCVSHWDRWVIPLPTRAQLQERLATQLDAVQQLIEQAPEDEDRRYFAHLSLFHELMHVEAIAWTRAFCGYPQPNGMTMPNVPKSAQVVIEHGTATHGVVDDKQFAFDNEVPPFAQQHAAFSIDSHVVRNDAFLQFVEDDGYARDEFWPADWRAQNKRAMPVRWRRNERGDVEHLHYGEWRALPLEEPVVHIAAAEAEAWCKWAGRRLPTAQEWEVAAARDDVVWGNSVWEWTASTFAPYPCFRPGPYVTYSAPWFHHQRELRGGAYATHALMHDRRYRNFFLPYRTDVFAGFRSVADA